MGTSVCPAKVVEMTPALVPSRTNQLQSPFFSLQIKISSSQETQQSLMQEKLREHLAEKEKLSEERLQQEEKLKARVKWLMEEKAVRRSLSFPSCCKRMR